MVHDEDKFRIRPGKVRDRGDARPSARRIGTARGRSTSFVGEVHQAIRRAGGNPNRVPEAGKGGGRFNARGRGAATALTLKDVVLIYGLLPQEIQMRHGAGTAAVHAPGRGGWR